MVTLCHRSRTFSVKQERPELFSQAAERFRTSGGTEEERVDEPSSHTALWVRTFVIPETTMVVFSFRANLLFFPINKLALSLQNAA